MGAGTGLLSIVASYLCNRVIVSDYISSIVNLAKV